MYEITIEDTFDAAHCLRNYQGSCQRLHGHTYKVRINFRFDSLDDNGMALDFKMAKSLLGEILDYFDHNYINDLPEFTQNNPTAENIARFIYDRMKLGAPQVYSVSIWETPTSCATYFEKA